MPKKSFVSKKESESFQIVHRSQRDPLLDDGAGSSQFVLRPINTPVTTATRVTLPSEVLPSASVPSVHQIDSAPYANRYCLDADEDIVDALEAASDDEFDELTDDFVVLANGIKPPSDNDARLLDLAGCVIGDDSSDENAADDEAARLERETQRHAAAIAAEAAAVDSRGTGDDMRQLLDARFERTLERNYASGSDDDDAVDVHSGGIDLDAADSDDDATDSRRHRLEQVLDEFLESQAIRPPGIGRSARQFDDAEDDEQDIESSRVQPSGAVAHKGRPTVADDDESSSSSEGMDEVELSEDEDDRWDCESILSTYSTSENRPVRIAEPSSGRARRTPALGLAEGIIKLSAKTGLPLGVLPSRPNSSNVAHSENMGSARDRTESVDEKKTRKAAVKMQRKQARQRKKDLKTMFDSEQRTQNLMRTRRPASSIVAL